MGARFKRADPWYESVVGAERTRKILTDECPTYSAVTVDIALTLGKRHPQLAGSDLVDASGHAHPGLLGSPQFTLQDDTLDVLCSDS